MNIELFFYYLQDKCKINPFDSVHTRSSWEAQFALLMDGITDSRMHDASLGFLGWYQHDYLYNLERKIIDIVRDSSLEDLIDKVEGDIASGSTEKLKFVKALHALSDLNEEFCSIP